MKNNKTRTLCEAAIFIAMAEILSFIKLYEFPNGGSVTLEMLSLERIWYYISGRALCQAPYRRY